MTTGVRPWRWQSSNWVQWRTRGNRSAPTQSALRTDVLTQASDGALLLAALASAEGDDDRAVELLLHMGLGSQPATIVYGGLARRLGVSSERAERLAAALAYGFGSDEGPTGTLMALRAVREEPAPGVVRPARRLQSDDAAGLVAPVLVAQELLVELAGRQAGELVPEVDRARDLVVGDVLAGELGQPRASWVASTPGTGCTTALTSSPISSLGTPKTATSATLGCMTRQSSISWG